MGKIKDIEWLPVAATPDGQKAIDKMWATDGLGGIRLVTQRDGLGDAIGFIIKTEDDEREECGGCKRPSLNCSTAPCMDVLLDRCELPPEVVDACGHIARHRLTMAATALESVLPLMDENDPVTSIGDLIGNLAHLAESYELGAGLRVLSSGANHHAAEIDGDCDEPDPMRPILEAVRKERQ